MKCVVDLRPAAIDCAAGLSRLAFGLARAWRERVRCSGYIWNPKLRMLTMATSSRSATATPKRSGKAGPKARRVRAISAGVNQTKKSATDVAIATELAPAVAIALLDRTEQAPGDPAPALDCLAAGAVPSETAGKVRVQLIFENGAVLPVEMSTDAAEALSKGLSEELPKA